MMISSLPFSLKGLGAFSKVPRWECSLWGAFTVLSEKYSCNFLENLIVKIGSRNFRDEKNFVFILELTVYLFILDF